MAKKSPTLIRYSDTLGHPKDRKPTRRTDRIATLIHRLGTGWLFVFAAVMTLIAGGLLTWVFPTLVRLSGASADTLGTWDHLEGFMALITISVVVGGGLFALAEYIEAEEDRKETERERIKQDFSNMVDRLMNEKETGIRGWIIRSVKPIGSGDDYDDWITRTREILFRNPKEPEEPAIGRRYVKHVLNTFDSLGFIALNFSKITEDHELMAWLNPMVTKVWERIGPYVEEEARRRNEPHYYKWARTLGETCIRWRVENNIPESNYVDDPL